MSSYFDTRSAELRVFREQGLGPNHEPVRVWVQAWIHDITLRAEFDRGVVGEGSWAFPEDLRDAMYGAIVHGWLEAYPLDRPGYVVDYAEDEEGMELLRATIEALHDLFHEAARRGIAGMDNPLAVRGELQYRRRTRTNTLLDLEAQ